MEDNKQPEASMVNEPTNVEDEIITNDVQNETDQALEREKVHRYESARSAAQEDHNRQTIMIEDELNLRFEIRGATTPLSVMLTGDAIIGRNDPIREITPEIDLTTYGGYQMGISRRHAVLKTDEKELQLIDLGSRNGTYINGQRVEANRAVVLHNGDEIRMGKIVIYIYKS